MRRMIATACVLTILAGGVCAQQSGPQTPALHKSDVAKKKKKRAGPKKAQESVAQAQPIPAQVAPPVPATPMNSSPVAPKVTMEGGLLTIDAPNSTLSDVLSAVQKATGATVEGASPTGRVAVRLGPGDPEQVIAALLHGTPYDYVILGSLEKHDVVTRVLLTQSSSASSSGGGQPGQGPAGWQRPPGNQPPVVDQPEAATPEDVASQPSSEPDQAQQPPPPQQPPQPQQPQQTPDQLFRQLQQTEQPPRQPAPVPAPQ